MVKLPRIRKPSDKTSHSQMPRIQKEMLACLQCGYCIEVCEAHAQSPWESVTPRGKIYYLTQIDKKNMLDPLLGRNVGLSPDFVEAMYRCTGCGNCEVVCHAELELVAFWEKLRAWMVQEKVAPLPAHKKLSEKIENVHNPYGESPDMRDAWWPKEVKREAIPDTVFFAGCTGSYRMQYIPEAGVRVLDRANVKMNVLGPKEWCCTSPALRTGRVDLTLEASQTIVNKADAMGAKDMVMTCSGCFKTISTDFGNHFSKAGQNVSHFTQYVEELIKERKLPMNNEFRAKVTYHDPCHLGRHSGVFEAPRNVLKKVKGLELIEMNRSRENSRCCGAGGGYKSAFNDLAVNIAAERIRDAEEVGAEIIATACPFCVLNLKAGAKQAGSNIKVMDISEILLKVTAPAEGKPPSAEGKKAEPAPAAVCPAPEEKKPEPKPEPAVEKKAEPAPEPVVEKKPEPEPVVEQVTAEVVPAPAAEKAVAQTGQETAMIYREVTVKEVVVREMIIGTVYGPEGDPFKNIEKDHRDSNLAKAIVRAIDVIGTMVASNKMNGVRAGANLKILESYIPKIGTDEDAQGTIEVSQMIGYLLRPDQTGTPAPAEPAKAPEPEPVAEDVSIEYVPEPAEEEPVRAEPVPAVPCAPPAEDGLGDSNLAKAIRRATEIITVMMATGKMTGERGASNLKLLETYKPKIGTDEDAQGTIEVSQIIGYLIRLDPTATVTPVAAPVTEEPVYEPEPVEEAPAPVPAAAVAGDVEEDEDWDMMEDLQFINENTPEGKVRRAAWNKGLRCRRNYGDLGIDIAFVAPKVAVYVYDGIPDTSSDALLESQGWIILRYKEDEITDGLKQAEEIKAAVKTNKSRMKKKKKKPAAKKK